MLLWINKMQKHLNRLVKVTVSIISVLLSFNLSCSIVVYVFILKAAMS